MSIGLFIENTTGDTTFLPSIPYGARILSIMVDPMTFALNHSYIYKKKIDDNLDQRPEMVVDPDQPLYLATVTSNSTEEVDAIMRLCSASVVMNHERRHFYYTITKSEMVSKIAVNNDDDLALINLMLTVIKTEKI